MRASGFLNFLCFKIPRDECSTVVSQCKLRTLGVFVEKSGFCEFSARIRYVLRGFVTDVGCETGWIDDDVVVVVEGEDLVVDRGHPAHAFDHPAQWFCHRYQLTTGSRLVFRDNLENLCRISGKGISESSLLVETSPKLGSKTRLLGAKNRLGACWQQTPSFWPRKRMILYDPNRFKTIGTQAAQTPSGAPAPHSLAGCSGASASETANANQSTPTGETPGQGGGQHVAV